MMIWQARRKMTDRWLLFVLILLLIQGCASSPQMRHIADIEIEPIEDLQPQINFDLSKRKVIKSYRELVEITPDSEGYGKEVQRLADLELEVSMDNKLSDDPAIEKRARMETQIAIQRYESYLKRYPHRVDNDLILYQLSRAYALEGETDKARARMEQLAANFPQSKYIDEVQFRRGETFFVEGKYAQAEQAYAVIVNNFTDSIYYEKALYKHGWAQFKQNNNDGAIQSFVTLLDYNQNLGKIEADRLPASLARADQELLNDVLRVVSLAFSYSSSKQPIAQFSNSHGKREFEPLLYLQLGELYLSKERITDAADNYLAYVQNYPFSIYTPGIHGLAIDAYQKAGFSELVLAEKRHFIENYNIGHAYWSQANKQTRENLQPILTQHLYDISTHYHALARNSKKVSDYKTAANWYQLYLDSFPDDKDAAEINFLLAETLFESKQYAKAIEEYEKTAYQYPPHKNSAEAGYAALTSYNALYALTKPELQAELNLRMIQSSLTFSDKFIEDKRMPSVLLNTSEKFFAIKKYNEAISASQRLVDDLQLDKKIHHQAWIIIAHSQFELKQYAQAENAYQQVIAGLAVKDTKTREQMRDQLASSIYLQGEMARNQGDHLLAAHHFQRLGKVVPTSDKKIIAQYDAATEYIALQDWPTTIAILEDFRRKYPKQKKWQQGVSEKLALAYNNTKQYGKAGREVMQLVALSPAKDQRDLLWQAAELQDKAGNPDKAIDIYKSYVKKYPEPLSRSIELRYKIAQSYRDKKDIKNYHSWLKSIIKADADAKTQRTDRSRYLAATSSLILIKPLHQQYNKARLTRPLKKSLKVKKTLMQKAIAEYTKAAKYQVEEVTTASTYNIAEIYRDFATALLKSEKPKNLNEDELEEYNYLLEDQAFPFEEKAIAIHETNIARIPGGSYDDSIQSSLQSLAKLMPFRYGKTEVSDQYVE
jgi:cellulose synthase operon protein C